MDIRLRAVELSDIDRIYEWENDFSLWNLSSNRSPFSRYAIENYVMSTQNQDIYTSKQFRFMIDLIEVVDNYKSIACVGCIDLYDFEPDNMKAGIGILIDRNHRKKGIASLAIIELAKYSKNILHLNQLYAFVPQDNHNSIKLFSNVGFQKTSCLKQWIKKNNSFIDVLVFQKYL